MPLNLLKLTSSISVHHHHHHHHRHKWLRRAITTGKSRPLPATCLGWCRVTEFAPQVYVINNNDNNRLGFRGPTSIRFYSLNKGGKAFGGGNASMESVSSDNRDEKSTPESEHDSSVMPALPSHDRRHQRPPPSHQNSSTKLLTLPTILTIARVAAVPLLISTFYMNSWLGTTATTSIFIAAAITDWLDGYLARRMNLGTAFGAFLDPVADKLMVAATLVLLCTRPPEAAMFGQLPWLLTVPSIAIIGREITMSAVREWAASQGSKLSEAVAVNNLGKWKTATQMSSLTILLVIRDSSFREVGFAWAAAGVGLLYVSGGLAVWSLVVYMKKIWKVMLM
ncbi:CDP-diacylglycerol--glycerol-3-phosphate 3-phosphatidyltransferase 2 [Cynara cardunculus var. scolymus]|uniref:CDP-diacylglycerol--glycerol-3-phosphate 1-phosphatidyltransferase n=1 Tax=Cynara cardunculus var. scolymus TaxID=59895 RepID=A0A103YIM1_CYNCS|nr:CDP-diacylglycerol--glycerol-3-phosphate 3-phosphatidyltransferase 2 [Cynara cardunculus var. scolymus]KVI09774.1 CDP-alcohol phosphatidyltransferase [Cynara cardunculus var. scolymus]